MTEERSMHEKREGAPPPPPESGAFPSHGAFRGEAVFYALLILGGDVSGVGYYLLAGNQEKGLPGVTLRGRGSLRPLEGAFRPARGLLV